ncbi:MAG: alpha/beta hydrolase [Deltaproteobacteria bacterium HGW-Deltaproteobacteria-19]|jgi:hypothetical protein|nr:MAG: alpha/beta hydrolase [Deltaproteobacteria bacterium HGW-Deltaproteobacteria-19]
MKPPAGKSYEALDRSEILRVLFYPRPEWGYPARGAFEPVLIPVDGDIVVGGRFHPSRKEGPNLLFFHGNGEIVADYDDMAPLFTRRGMNLLAVDYRGYGRSTGTPTLASMMADSHTVLAFAREWLEKNGHTGPLLVMGRSLGSASALELASSNSTEIDGLIIESGFAWIGPLLALMGFRLEFFGLSEEDGPENLKKIGMFEKPTLVIHAEFDHIIPYAEGKALYDASPSAVKRMLTIEGANHNDIFYQGMNRYLDAVEWLANEAAPAR